MKKLFAAHKILSLIVAAAIILSGVPLTEVSAADVATAGVTATDDAAIGLSGEIDPDNGEPADTDQEEQQEEQEYDPVDEDDGSVATSGVTVTEDDASCTCTAFQSDPDCPVCKDDATQCFFYYCVCEALCGEDDINHDCPICRDDYTKCVQAVEVPELAPLAEWTDGQEVSGTISGDITVTGTVTVTGKLTISGTVTIGGSGTLKRGTDYKGDIISVPSGASLILENITIDGGNQDSITGVSGCLVNVLGTLTMNSGATLQNNTNVGDNSGGGVSNSGNFTMSGGEISSNTANNSGGGVLNSGTFTMNGGEISENTASGGGGVSNGGSSGKFTMSGGTISGNTATGNGGGVNHSGGTFTISGSPKIENNIKGSGTPQGTGGVYLSSGKTITIASAHLSGGASIGIEGVYNGTDTTVASGAVEGDLQYFYISNADKKITTVYPSAVTYNSLVFDTNVIKLGNVQQFYVSSGGNDGNTGADTDNALLTIEEAYSRITGTRGEILVMDDITVSATITLDGAKTVTLKSDGTTTRTLTRGVTGNLITVGSDVTLILENIIIDGNKGVVTNGGGSLVKVGTGGTLTINNGAILQNNTIASDGGGVYNSGTFNMNGGKIWGNTNTTNYGGGVYNSGTFNMNGGKIWGNTANIGGGVSNNGGSANFTMSGGEISGNTAGNSGGVYNYNGTFTMNGGTISNNTAQIGGGVYNSGNSGTFNMVGGTISGNTATTNGGGVRHGGTAFNISGSPKIENNIKDSGGTANTGGVYLNSGKNITIDTAGLTDGARIGLENIQTPTEGTTVATNAVEGDLHYFYISNFGGHIGGYELVFSTDKIVLATVLTPITGAAISVTAPVVAAAPNTTTTGTGNFSRSTVTWTPTITGGKFLGGTQYTASVTLTANSGCTFTGLTTATINGYAATVTNNTGSAVTLSYQFGATAAATVSGISILTQPSNLSYTHGDALNLSGLVTRLTYNDGTTSDVAFANFGTNGLTASPANGTTLNMSHNGTKVTVTHTATGKTAQTNALTVNKATPTVTFPTSATATYGDTLANVTYSGQSGAGTFTWTSGNSTSVGSVGAQSHSMTFTPTDSTNYETLTQSVSVTVNKATLTITGATIAPKVYDGNTTIANTAVTPTFSGTVSGDTITSTVSAAAYTDSKNVGTGKPTTFTVTLTGDSDTNYSLTNATYTGATANITAKDISIATVTALTKTYDGNATATAGAVTFIDTVDTLTEGTDYSVTAVFTGGNYNAGSSKPYTYTVTMQNTTAANNYNLTGGNTKTGSDGVINKADAPTGVNQTVEATTNLAKAYSFDLTTLLPSTPSLTGITYKVKSVSNGDGVLSTAPSVGTVTSPLSLDVAEVSTAGKTATVTITVSSDNYADFDAVITVTTVAKIPLTITGLTVNSKVYNGTTDATLSGTATLVTTNVQGGDEVSLTGTPSAVFANANVGTDKTVTITGLLLTGDDANKYSLDLSGIKGTITAKTPTASDLTYSLTTKDYTGSAQAVSVTKQDSSLGDVTVYYDGSTTPPTNAGTYAVTVDIAASANFSAKTGLSLGNYVISKVQLTVTAENKSITFGAAPPTYTAAYTGFVGGETSSVLNGSPAFACSYTQGGGATTYTITPSTGSLSATNYSFSFANGTLTVGKATQAALTVTGTPATVTYGDTFTLGTTGGSGSGAVTYEVTSGNSYATVNSSSGAVTITGVGSVIITATKAADANHSAAVTATTTFTSVKRNLSNAAVSVSGTYTYDGTAKTPTPTVTDSGATIASSDWEIDTSAGTNGYSNNINAGTATVQIKATSGGNYTGTKTANFTINPANVTTAALTVTPPATGTAKTDASVSGSANYTHTSTAWTITGTGAPAGVNFAASTAYTATVTLAAKTNYVFGTVPTGSVTGAGGTVTSAATSPDKSTLTIVVNYPATAAKQVVSIAVTNPTKTVYYSGDTLDVAGLEVTATYDDGSTGVVTPSGYAIDGKAFTPGSTLLTATQNGKPITVTYSGQTDTTGNLTVKTPPVISNVTVTDITASTATISYTATKGTEIITVNKLEYRTGSGNWTAAANGSPITGLASGTAYQYRITVSDGTKEVSRSGSFQTPTSGSTGVTVSGTVTDPGNPANIIVTIEHGNTVIASVTIAGSGTYNFSFSGIPNGIYNLVADNGSYKVTQAVTVSGVDVTGVSIAMTQGNTQSVVDIITPDTPPAAVDGLPNLFNDTTGTIYTADDQDLVENKNGTVEIKLAVEQKDNPGDSNVITGAASGQTVGLYLDLSVIKSQFDSTGALLDETKLTNLGSNLITITFELPDELKGKTGLTIYRVHGGSAEALPKSPNANNDGEYFEISGNIVTLTVCKFSTYAITYTAQSPTNPPVNPPSSSSGGGSSGGSGGGSGAGTSTIVSTYWIELAEAKAMAKTAKEKELDYVRSRRATITGIRKNALLALTGLRYQHDTVADSAVQVRIYVDDPAKAAKDILVSGYVKGNIVDTIKAKFGKWFTNKIAVVSFDQQGDFGMIVQIAAKIDLSGMDTNNLYFYGYDRKTNKYSRINTEYRIDTNGYLHFATGLAGDIIVSNAPLAKKTEEQIAADGDKYYYLAATPTLESLNIDGGDSMFSVSEPPTQEAPQNPTTGGESLSYMNAADTPLTLEKVDNNSGGGALVIDLDASVTQDALSDSLKRDKVSVYLVLGITSVLLLAAMMLWAAIPRKDDPLVSVEDYRKKH